MSRVTGEAQPQTPAQDGGSQPSHRQSHKCTEVGSVVQGAARNREPCANAAQRQTCPLPPYVTQSPTPLCCSPSAPQTAETAAENTRLNLNMCVILARGRCRQNIIQRVNRLPITSVNPITGPL